ncbi:TPA: hypothetical protein DCF80_01525 [Candidatus Saccharibacteria bacterium]|nr:hypothetical protein [Candidatus Saccharibacteria bacterium]HRK40769.1 hypothetical protein [Candidatus Saccharibacteria bacterium]
MPERAVETVAWINVVPLNRREMLARWWQEDVCQGSTYISERQHEQDFMTVIPVESLEGVACGGLRQALTRQKHDIEQSARSITYPRATPDGTEYFGSIAIPSKPLNVRFTETGIVTMSHEDH